MMVSLSLSFHGASPFVSPIEISLSRHQVPPVVRSSHAGLLEIIRVCTLRMAPTNFVLPVLRQGTKGRPAWQGFQDMVADGRTPFNI